MKIFDCHVHLERPWTAYDLPQAQGANVIFNDVAEYRARRRLLRPGDAASLILDFRRNFAFVAGEVRAGRARAVKISAPTQKIERRDHAAIDRRLASLPRAVPVIYDGFFYGDDLAHQPSVAHLIHLARRFPDRTFIAAHAGGYRVLEFFFHLRPLKNIVYDLSVSLQYFEDSSCFPDYVKLIRFTDKKRVMFGSDFPYGSAKRQATILSTVLRRIGASRAETEQIFHGNAVRLFHPNR